MHTRRRFLGLVGGTALTASVAGCTGGSEAEIEPETVSLTASDGVGIEATYYASDEETPPAVVLAHQLGGDRSQWGDFPRLLAHEGFSVVSVDLRGHGESEGDWQSFEEADFRGMVNDVAAAESYLFERGADDSRTGMAGASIGANTVLDYVSEGDPDALLLLSPAKSYRGIDVVEEAETYDKPALVGYFSEDRSEAARNEAGSIGESLGAKVEEYEGEGHGVDALDIEGKPQEYVDWLSSNLSLDD
ncbi:MAG: alpha/beta fold hydrolase [Halobacteria archaeon]|nr:alpha/beta fold hydrolase [Halobacteria archaeon]